MVVDTCGSELCTRPLLLQAGRKTFAEMSCTAVSRSCGGIRLGVYLSMSCSCTDLPRSEGVSPLAQRPSLERPETTVPCSPSRRQDDGRGGVVSHHERRTHPNKKVAGFMTVFLLDYSPSPLLMTCLLACLADGIGWGQAW